MKWRREKFSVQIHEPMKREEFKEMLQETLKEAFKKGKGKRVGVNITHPALEKPIPVPFSFMPNVKHTRVRCTNP